MKSRELRGIYKNIRSVLDPEKAHGVLQSPEQAARILSTDQLEVSPGEVIEFLNTFFRLDAKADKKVAIPGRPDFSAVNLGSARAVREIYNYGLREGQFDHAVMDPETVKVAHLATMLIEDSLTRQSVFEFIEHGGNITPALQLVNSLAKVYNNPLHRQSFPGSKHDILKQHLDRVEAAQLKRRSGLIEELDDEYDEPVEGDPTVDSLQSESQLISTARQMIDRKLEQEPTDPRTVLYLMKNAMIAADYYTKGGRKLRTHTLYREVVDFPRKRERVYNLTTHAFEQSRAEQVPGQTAVHFDPTTLPLGGVLAEQYFIEFESE